MRGRERERACTNECDHAIHVCVLICHADVNGFLF